MSLILNLVLKCSIIQTLQVIRNVDGYWHMPPSAKPERWICESHRREAPASCARDIFAQWNKRSLLVHINILESWKIQWILVSLNRDLTNIVWTCLWLEMKIKPFLCNYGRFMVNKWNLLWDHIMSWCPCDSTLLDKRKQTCNQANRPMIYTI